MENSVTRYEPNHKAHTRERLLAETAAALCKHGPDGVSVVSLMGLIGLTHGAFYGHFKSKDALVAEAISVMFSGAHAWFSKINDGLPPCEGLSKYVDFYLSDGHTEDVDNGCALPAIASDVSRMKARSRQNFTEGTLRLYGAFAARLREAGFAEGDAEAAARSAFSEMAGAVVIARAVEPPQNGRAVREATRRAIKARLGLP